MPINIHLQICFRIINGAKCPINIKSVASLNMRMPFLPSNKQLIFHEKHVKTGSFLLHLDSAIQNQIHIDTTYNEHLRPKFFYLVLLIHVTSYKLCLVIWTPPFSLILTSNVRILLQSSQIMDTYLFHHRQGHLELTSQLVKTFSAQISGPFRNKPLQYQDPIAHNHRERLLHLGIK